MSKSHVAPIKSITLPKLELMAAVVSTRLAQFVISSMDFQCHVPPYDIHFWMDSQIILYWKYKTNNLIPDHLRISHHGKGIAKLFSANLWSYTPSSDNPADSLIRAILIQQLMSSQLWSQGPIG